MAIKGNETNGIFLNGDFKKEKNESFCYEFLMPQEKKSKMEQFLFENEKKVYKE